MKANFELLRVFLRTWWRSLRMTTNLSEQNIVNAPNSAGEKLIQEGAAEIRIPDGAKIFYNPVQEFNRDLSIAVLQADSARHYNGKQNNSKVKKFSILEALSATGLRSIRYAKEVPNVTEIVANDISKSASEVIEQNIKRNNVENIVKCSNLDAVEVMFNSRHPTKRFHVVDLDPYGCPSQFLETAVQCVEDGGLLLVTCTDMAVLCGNGPETSFVKYGSVALKINSCHEMALRIALYCIQSYAAKHKRYIEPVISISVDFYIRVIVRLFTSAEKCKEITSKLSMVYHCTGCDATNFQPLGLMKLNNKSQTKHVYKLAAAPVVEKFCLHCNGKHQLGGPIWTGKLHDLEFVRDTISMVENKDFKTKNRLLGVLNMITEELYDIPLYYNLPKMCSVLGCTPIPMMTFRSAILNGGFRISFSHANRSSFKTDAPMSFIWDILKEWIKQNLHCHKEAVEGTPAFNIRSKAIASEIDFSLRPDANPTSRKNKLLRFQMNPGPFWGPGMKSSCIEIPQKTLGKQNKKKRRALEMLDGCDVKKAINEETESNS